MNTTLYISHEPKFLELADMIIKLDKGKNKYDCICSMATGEVLACRVIGDAWEILV